MIKTRLTEMWGTQYPIMLSGMNYITDPKLVAAVSNAGGLGMLACARYTPEQVKQHIKTIRDLTDKPWGINQSLRKDAQKKIEIIVGEQVKFLNYSLGKPWFIDDVHKYGGKVFGTVAIARHAASAAKLGVDAVVTTGYEAAGHPDTTPSMILIPLVADMVKIPIIAAGGFADGRGLAAALSLGADGIAMGTRFMMSQESALSQQFKDLCLKATEQDTLYSNKFDGLPARMLKTKSSEELYNGKFNIFESAGSAMGLKKELKLSWWEFLQLSWSMMTGDEKLGIFQQARQANYAKRLQKAVFEGDVEKGMLPTGMVCGEIHDIPTVKEIIERTIKQAEEVIEASKKKVS
jgi:enoyl-[acyl-carrier protein] reductase II